MGVSFRHPLTNLKSRSLVSLCVHCNNTQKKWPYGLYCDLAVDLPGVEMEEVVVFFSQHSTLNVSGTCLIYHHPVFVRMKKSEVVSLTKLPGGCVWIFHRHWLKWKQFLRRRGGLACPSIVFRMRLLFKRMVQRNRTSRRLGYTGGGSGSSPGARWYRLQWGPRVRCLPFGISRHFFDVVCKFDNLMNCTVYLPIG